ncbi:MAG: 2OG-Fe(II) oxygenase [Cyclobacteriaceae bacterium]|nr:2OG-Fe(II) oxygenase [Cyclobacteriaceae bacterium]
MESNFEEIISGFLEKRVGIANEFLSADLALHLKENLLLLFENKAMKEAGIGNGLLLSHDKKIRSDKIFWLEKKDNNPHERIFFDLIDSFILYLNRTCFTGIKSYEFHYALYEKGAFYKKHLDQFKSDDGRAFSMIMYLNKGWLAKDGGELKVYQETGIQIIPPDNQKCIFFKSNELEHEVLLTNVTRMSVTGWLKTSL